MGDTAWSEYYFAKKLQGDVVGVYRASDNALVAFYEYDAWGNILYKYGEMTDINPFRYRTYYYDNETWFYYLQSRYYDPAIGRFINADAFVSTGQGIIGCNMFAYCGNNPIARTDEAGTIWKDVIRLFMHARNMALVAIGFDTAALGAACLDMKIDSAGVYHAEFDCRQQKFGYNILYDIVFDIGTYMLADFFPFTCDGEGYTIWVWKASYINLGAGAELAIYRGNSGHRTVDKSLAMPMTMTLLYKGETIITHGTYHWWATGFNPNYLNVFASDLTAIFSIYFGNREMFYAFMDKHNKDPRWSFDSNYYKATLQF